MIDDLDKKILNMLIANGRQSSREITKKLGEEGFKISERGLGKRIAKLERDKIITGYTAIVDMKRVNMGIPRLVTVKLSSPKDFVHGSFFEFWNYQVTQVGVGTTEVKVKFNVHDVS